MSRKAYPSDVSDEEWAFVAPYLTLMKEDAPQREFPLRDLFNALRYFVRAGCPWRMLPNDLPPWTAVQQQALRWMKAGCFEAMAHDLRAVVRLLQERAAEPTAVVLDGRTLQSSPESGGRAGYDGYKRKKGSKVHVAVDTLGNLLAVAVTPANEQERAQVDELWPRRCRRPPDKASNWPTRTKATRASPPPGLLPRTASAWRSSNSRPPNAVSYCCPGAGWSNAPLPGWPAFAVFRVTTNALPPPSPGCIGWLLPACCSATCSESTTKVNDRL